MYRWIAVVATIFLVAALGCSGSGTTSPTSPDSNLTNNSEHATSSVNGQTLWGYYDLHFDFNAGTVEAVVNRSVMFNANVVQFINSNPAGLQFDNIVVEGAGPVNVNIDVGISHPLNDGAYDGYDVMGTFIGEGSQTLAHNGAAISQAGVDQYLNNADGYTRWFNPSEFGVPGVLGYTPGAYATGGYNGSATVNGYKLFANGLGATDDAGEFVATAGGPGNNVFLHGTSNTRHYDIDFPVPDPNVVYNYAIVASWAGELPENHPANTTEAVAYTATQTESLSYDETNGPGGNLILDLTLAGYTVQPSVIYIESSVLDSVASIDPTSVNTGGNATSSTYHIDLAGGTFTGNEGHTALIMAEYSGSNYGNDFGVPNDAEDDPLTAYFRIGLVVTEGPPCPGVTVTGTDTIAVGPTTYTGIEVYGTGFTGSGGATTADVEYSGAGGTVVATNVVVVDDGTLTCDADFSTLTADGPLDITVTSDCNSEGVGADLTTYSCGGGSIYSNSFVNGDGDASNWNHASGYWTCGFFTSGQLNSREASCNCYSGVVSTSWCGRTIGYDVPTCFSGSVDLHVTHGASQEAGGWDIARITYGEISTPIYSTGIIFNTTGPYSMQTNNINLSSMGAAPGDTFYLWFWQGGIDSLFNCYTYYYYTGYTITDISID